MKKNGHDDYGVAACYNYGDFSIHNNRLKQKSGWRAFSTAADWSSRREVAFQNSTERAKSVYVLAPGARQKGTTAKDATPCRNALTSTSCASKRKALSFNRPFPIYKKPAPH
ncbi:hypothetical protein AC623_13525 [Bacillus sp. FJAT-27231]|nr:hypothetical protein AC623_13525 [Bacillus sp. FJAT-27231]